LALLAGAPPAK